MNKAELIAASAEKSGLSQAVTRQALDGIMEAIADGLSTGDEIRLIGFGSFSLNRRAAYTGRNPQTGEAIEIAAKNVVKFKAGSRLVGQVNGQVRKRKKRGGSMPPARKEKPKHQAKRKRSPRRLRDLLPR